MQKHFNQLELGNRKSRNLKKGKRVGQTKQGVCGAAQGVGDRVPGQETQLRGAGGEPLLHGTFYAVICDCSEWNEQIQIICISYLHSS